MLLRYKKETDNFLVEIVFRSKFNIFGYSPRYPKKGFHQGILPSLGFRVPGVKQSKKEISIVKLK